MLLESEDELLESEDEDAFFSESDAGSILSESDDGESKGPAPKKQYASRRSEAMRIFGLAVCVFAFGRLLGIGAAPGGTGPPAAEA